MRILTGLLLLAWLPVTHAAGIDCERAAKPVEHLICTDPVLRAQDAALATAWERALAATSYREELKADQREWLDRRRSGGMSTDEDIRWLRFGYALRLAELEPQAVAGRFRWQGRWIQADPPGYAGEIVIRPDGTHGIHAEFEAVARGNVGSLSGPAAVDRDLATLASPDFTPECKVTLRRMHRQLDVDHAGYCGEGSGVHFSGRYVPAESRATPDWNLLTLGLVREPADDAAIRQAMGAEAYARMIEIIDFRSPMDAHMGTRFVELGRRGNDQALLQRDGQRFWIISSAQGGQELRYYTNDAASAAQVPSAFDEFRGRMRYPVRLMSAPGQPLLTGAAVDAR